MQNLKEIVKPLYTQCFTVTPDANVSEIMGRLLADNFQSIGSADVKTKTQLTEKVLHLSKLVPDMKFEIQEMLQDSNKVVVRSIASGAPNGNFMGIPADGSRSFKVMAVDIHTIENGQIVQIHHIEDWATAIGQLKA